MYPFPARRGPRGSPHCKLANLQTPSSETQPEPLEFFLSSHSHSHSHSHTTLDSYSSFLPSKSASINIHIIQNNILVRTTHRTESRCSDEAREPPACYSQRSGKGCFGVSAFLPFPSPRLPLKPSYTLANQTLTFPLPLPHHTTPLHPTPFSSPDRGPTLQTPSDSTSIPNLHSNSKALFGCWASSFLFRSDRATAPQQSINHPNLDCDR
jgi:hypothetical protein